MTQRIRSILVATDLSEASEEVMRAAAGLAAAKQAELHVLHAFDFPSTSQSAESVAPPSFQGKIEAVERDLDEQIRRTVPDTVRVASRRVEIYVAHRAIIDGARGAAADLIVVGPHSHRRLGDEILGSTADRVLRTADVPCLVVRAPLSLPLRRVVVPFDLSPSAIGALEVGLAWAVILGARHDASSATELTVLHIMPRAFDLPEFPFDREAIGPDLHREVEAARQRVSGASELDVREDLRWGDTPVDEIVRVAADEQTDLLVLGTHGHGILKRALIGSVASGVARRASCPVLLVPPKFSSLREGEDGSGNGIISG
jgi:nucleotide-binding universal stress UspA family protein